MHLCNLCIHSRQSDPKGNEGVLPQLQRRLTGDRREFSEVMAMARRTSSQSGGSALVHSRRPTNVQVRHGMVGRNGFGGVWGLDRCRKRGC